MTFDGFRPDRWDITGAAICLLGVAAGLGSRRRGQVKIRAPGRGVRPGDAAAACE